VFLPPNSEIKRSERCLSVFILILIFIIIRLNHSRVERTERSEIANRRLPEGRARPVRCKQPAGSSPKGRVGGREQRARRTRKIWRKTGKRGEGIEP
jgi:hypothetical protein